MVSKLTVLGLVAVLLFASVPFFNSGSPGTHGAPTVNEMSQGPEQTASTVNVYYHAFCDDPWFYLCTDYAKNLDHFYEDGSIKSVPRGTCSSPKVDVNGDYYSADGAIYTDPQVGAGDQYNRADGYDDSGNPAQCEVTYRCGAFSTEYNPQMWEHQRWFSVNSYADGLTWVFAGWKYLDSNGFLTGHTYAPGEMIVPGEDGWYAVDIDNPEDRGTKLADMGEDIHIYATWAKIKHVIYDKDSVPRSTYSVEIGGKVCFSDNNDKNIVGIQDAQSSSFKIYDDEIIPERKYIKLVHERFYVQDGKVTAYGKEGLVADGRVIIDGYSFEVKSSGGKQYIEYFYFPILKIPVTTEDGEKTTEQYVVIRGDVYAISHEASTIAGNVLVMMNGEGVNCPLAGDGFLGCSRFYLLEGTVYTHIRIIENNVTSQHVNSTFFDDYTIRGKTSLNSIDLGNKSFNIGSGGCFIDNLKVTTTNGQSGALHSNGNLLVFGTNVSSAENGLHVDGQGTGVKKTRMIVHSGTYSDIVSGAGSSSNVIIVKDATVKGDISGGNGRTFMYVVGNTTVNGVIAGYVGGSADTEIVLCDMTDAEFNSVQHAEKLIVDASEVGFLGSDIGGSTYSLYDIGELTLRGGSIIALDHQVDLGGYSSLDNKGVPTLPENPVNGIVLADGLNPSISETRDGVTTYGIVSGYTLVSFVDPVDACSARIIGNLDSDGGFVMIAGQKYLVMDFVNETEYGYWIANFSIVIVAKSMILPQSQTGAVGFHEYVVFGLPHGLVADDVLSISWCLGEDEITGVGVYENKFDFEFSFNGKSVSGESDRDGNCYDEEFPNIRIIAYSGIVSVIKSGYSSVVVSVGTGEDI